MAERMLQFVRLQQQTPRSARSASAARDFDEIYRDFATPAQAAAQASRCSQCGVPFCQVHCPLGNNIPDWLKLTAEGRLEEAYEVVQRHQQLPRDLRPHLPAGPAVRGQLRHREGLRQRHHRRGRALHHRHARSTDGWVKPLRPRRELRQSVGIIGAGPGGLAAAEQLRRQGYQVHCLRPLRPGRRPADLRHPRASSWRSTIVLRRWKLLEEAGIVFDLDCEVGRDVTFAGAARAARRGADRDRRLQGARHRRPGRRPARHRAGAGLPDRLQPPGPRRRGGRFRPPARSMPRGKHVVVIGGGDTAMDCVRTAVRQGAASVKCLYRRDRANMPGSMREVKNAEEEGVEFVWLSAPEAFLGDDTVDRRARGRGCVSACPTRRAASPSSRSRAAISPCRPTW